MKNTIGLVYGFLLVLLFSCSGSETYRGTWKAMDADGNRIEILFDAKSFVVKTDSLEQKEYKYTQTQVRIENSVKTYGIQLEDGRKYQIYFPNSDDESLGLIRDEHGGTLYTISRNEFLQPENIYKLN